VSRGAKIMIRAVERDIPVSEKYRDISVFVTAHPYSDLRF